MMEIISLLIPVGILACAIVALIYLKRAICFIFAKQFWSGAKAFLASCAFGLVPGFVVMVMFGSLTHNQSPRITCSNNIKQSLLFMKIYANDNNESYPATFNELVMGNYLKVQDLGIFICTASGHKVGSSTNIHEWTDYAYVSGLTDTDTVDCVVAFCLHENHKGEGTEVGFIGGRVEWCFCQHSYTNAFGRYLPSFHDLTNTPSLFFGTTNEAVIADLKKRTRIIYPKHHS